MEVIADPANLNFGLNGLKKLAWSHWGQLLEARFAAVFGLGFVFKSIYFDDQSLHIIKSYQRMIVYLLDTNGSERRGAIQLGAIFIYCG